MAGASSLSSTLLLQNSPNFPHQSSRRPLDSTLLFSREKGSITVCSAKKKIRFVDQILDYIEGGPKLRKWYDAPNLLPKDRPAAEDEDEYLEDEVRDAVLVTDGDSEMAQSIACEILIGLLKMSSEPCRMLKPMVILSMIVKKTRVKALVKDKLVALEAFGSYVEMSVAGDTCDRRFLKKALRGVGTIICPNVCIFFPGNALLGAYKELDIQSSNGRGRRGIQSMMKSNAKKLAELDESVLGNSGIPYTIIRTGLLQDTPGGKQGFSCGEGCAARGSLSKEDAAFVCVGALECVPQSGFIFEVVNFRIGKNV